MEKAILDINDISELIGKTPKAIRIAMSRGQEGITVPPSTKIGGRRAWVREVVEQWLKDIATQAMEEYEEKKRAAHDLYYVQFVSWCFNLFRLCSFQRRAHPLKNISLSHIAQFN